MRWGEESGGGRAGWRDVGGAGRASHYSQRAPSLCAPSRGRGVMAGRLARRRDRAAAPARRRRAPGTPRAWRCSRRRLCRMRCRRSAGGGARCLSEGFGLPFEARRSSACDAGRASNAEVLRWRAELLGHRRRRRRLVLGRRVGELRPAVLVVAVLASAVEADDPLAVVQDRVTCRARACAPRAPSGRRRSAGTCTCFEWRTAKRSNESHLRRAAKVASSSQTAIAAKAIITKKRSK